MHTNQALASAPKERVDIHTGLLDLSRRLDEISRQTSILRIDVTGEENAESQTAQMPPCSLDSQVFSLFTVVSEIECDLGRIASRLGVSFAPQGQQNAKAGLAR